MLLSKNRRPRDRENRRGVITILAALFSIVFLAITALSVDIGFLLSVKEEMQRTADAAALAAAWEYGAALAEDHDPDDCELIGRQAASNLAVNNVVNLVGPALDSNYSNADTGDVLFGHIDDFDSPNPTLVTGNEGTYNAVRVKVRRDATLNGEAPLFFARIFGRTGQALEAQATAAIIRDISGFQIPASGENLDILPYALDLQTYNTWMAGVGDDDWTWDSEAKAVRPGCDGMLEVNLYPQGTGSPGNRGTVDIGSSNNSTNDIARQILHGINASDMAYHSNSLEFNQCGKLYLNGDTGISAGVKDELAAIKGQPRIIPIFSEVNGPGNNAIYTIVKWMGIRIVDVKLTGPMNKKHVTIQVGPMVTAGAIPSTVTGSSSYVYSPASLIR